MVKAYRAAMDAGKHTVDPVLTNFKSKYAVDWSPYLNKKWTDAPTPQSRWPSGSAWPKAHHHGAGELHAASRW